MDDVRTLMFDFGGVLVNLNKQACLDAFSKIGITDIAHSIDNYAQTGLFLQLEKGHVSATDFRNELRNMFGSDVHDSEIDKAWNAFLLDIPDYKLELLLELKKKYRMIMLSNTNEIHFEQKAQEEFSKLGYRVEDYFDKCYLSYKLGVAKPQKEIFEHVLKEEGTPASEILFLDDGPRNIEIAKSMGFQTYLVKEYEDFRPLFL